MIMAVKPMQVLPKSYEYDMAGQPSTDGSRQLLSAGMASLRAKAFYLNNKKISNYFGQWLDTLLTDWLDVALAVYVADRLSLRRDLNSIGNHLQWARVFRLRLPVRHPEVWGRSEVNRQLRELLRYF